MESRDKLLEAAARVYAESGFRGATTRRIAEEAGVNEVTIFRHFGSKAALIDEAVRCRAAFPAAHVPPLPETPVDPERELTAWCAAHLAQLRAVGSLIRKTMGELEERPAVAPCAIETPLIAAAELKRYMIRLRQAGLTNYGECRPAGRNEYAHAAGAMLMGALFADAMGREMMPEMYPQPADRAPELYVRLFLCAIGVTNLEALSNRTPGAGRTGGRGTHLSPTKKRS